MIQTPGGGTNFSSPDANFRICRSVGRSNRLNRIMKPRDRLSGGILADPSDHRLRMNDIGGHPIATKLPIVDFGGNRFSQGN